jgi:hypothetical protein
MLVNCQVCPACDAALQLMDVLEGPVCRACKARSAAEDRADPPARIRIRRATTIRVKRRTNRSFFGPPRERD